MEHPVAKVPRNVPASHVQSAVRVRLVAFNRRCNLYDYHKHPTLCQGTIGNNNVLPRPHGSTSPGINAGSAAQTGLNMY